MRRPSPGTHGNERDAPFSAIRRALSEGVKSIQSRPLRWPSAASADTPNSAGSEPPARSPMGHTVRARRRDTRWLNSAESGCPATRRSSRAINEACKSGAPPIELGSTAMAPPAVLVRAVSGTTFVTSSRNNGTPSVRLTISSTTSGGRAAASASRCPTSDDLRAGAFDEQLEIE